MAEPYISFEEMDEYLTNDPINGDNWIALSEADRQKWHKWVHNQINQHPWKGDPLVSFVVRQAFPRRISRGAGDCPREPGGHPVFTYVVRFDSDPEADPKCDAIIPRQLLAEAVSGQLTSADIDELIQLRDIGVQRVKTGPLETEFQDNAQGNNPWRDMGTPLPEPLWSNLQGFSTMYQEQSSTFRIERG